MPRWRLCRDVDWCAGKRSFDDLVGLRQQSLRYGDAEGLGQEAAYVINAPARTLSAQVVSGTIRRCSANSIIGFGGSDPVNWLRRRFGASICHAVAHY